MPCLLLPAPATNGTKLHLEISCDQSNTGFPTSQRLPIPTPFVLLLCGAFSALKWQAEFHVQDIALLLMCNVVDTFSGLHYK
jgi:hypothetical protein